MDTVKICGVAVVCITIFSIIKAYNPSFEIPMRLSATVLFLGVIFGAAGPVIVFVRGMMAEGETERFASSVVTAFGIAFLTQICAEVCRDCKEASIASYVETVGRVEILLLCLPLIKEILQAVDKLLSL